MAAGALHAREAHHVDVPQRAVVPGLGVGEDHVCDEDARAAFDEGGDGVEEDLADFAIGPVVQDVAEEISVCACFRGGGS